MVLYSYCHSFIGNKDFYVKELKSDVKIYNVHRILNNIHNLQNSPSQNKNNVENIVDHYKNVRYDQN